MDNFTVERKIDALRTGTWTMVEWMAWFELHAQLFEKN